MLTPYRKAVVAAIAGIVFVVYNAWADHVIDSAEITALGNAVVGLLTVAGVYKVKNG